MPKQKWAIEGDLLHTQMQIDKLKKKEDLSEQEREELSELEKRKSVLEKKFRNEHMKHWRQPKKTDRREYVGLFLCVCHEITSYSVVNFPPATGRKAQKRRADSYCNTKERENHGLPESHCPLDALTIPYSYIGCSPIPCLDGHILVSK